MENRILIQKYNFILKVQKLFEKNTFLKTTVETFFFFFIKSLKKEESLTRTAKNE